MLYFTAMMVNVQYGGERQVVSDTDGETRL